MNKPLLVSEIPDGMIAHLDQQRTIKLSDGKSKSHVLIECPQCHEQRWAAIANIRNGHTKTSVCRACYLQRGNFSMLKPEEISSLQNTIVFFDRQELLQEKSGRLQQMMRILAECPDCHKQRWIRVNSFRNGKTKSTVCNGCSRKRQPHKPAKGTYDANGYRMIHLALLPNEDQELARQYLTVHRRHYVYEHRLVALKTFGPAAVVPGSVIRHIDGNKLNNSPNNLIPGTQSDNRMDHVTILKELHAWRSLAMILLQITPIE